MFNKISRIFFAAASMAVVMVACKKEVNDDIISPRSEVKFATSDTGTMALPKVYYVENNPNSMFRIPVGFTTVSDQDRTINISYSSPTGAAQGTQFTAPTTITIPAGQAADTVELKGLFAGYAGNRVDTIRVKVTSPDAPSSQFASTYHLVLRPYCEVDLTALAGPYNSTMEYTSAGALSWGPYTTVLKDIVQTSATTATAKIENIYDFGWNDLNVVLNWANPANFTVTMPAQSSGTGYNVVSASGQLNTFSSCERSITLTLNITGAGTATNYRVVMK